MPDMTVTFAQAACGDVAAQAAMLDHMVMTALRPGAVSAEFLAGIELWARMLATHDRPEHKRRLAGVLLFKGSIHRIGARPELAEPLIAEGLRMLRLLADAGYQRAGAQLCELSRRLDRDHSLPAEIMLGDDSPTSH